MGRKRILLFAYDGTGLGHLMRLIKIASGFSNQCDILVASGHNALPKLIPSGIDFYSLPNFYDERDKGKSNAEVNGKRIVLIRNLVLNYKPDAFVTDYLPLGKRLELYSIITSFPCKKYFILRSELGGEVPAKNDVFSERNIIYLEKYYRKIFVASDSRITNPSFFSWLSDNLRNKMYYSGFVALSITADDVKETRREWLRSDYKKWVVCSAGGGKRGATLIKECIKLSLDIRYKDFQFDVILGYYSPLLSDIPKPMNHNIRIIQWTNALYKLHASADYVICSGAYNSLTESMQGKSKIVFSLSVLNNEEDDEQEKNIEKLSGFYNIRKIPSVSEVASVFAQTITNNDSFFYSRALNMNGISNICNEIELDLD